MKKKLTYEERLKSQEWIQKREEILTRDNYTCLACGSKNQLHVHHRQYHTNSQGEFLKPWEYSGKYLVTLCHICHELGHKKFSIIKTSIETL